MTDEELIRRCDVLEILDNEGSLGRTRKLVEQLAAITIEAQAAEIERLRDALAKAGRDLNVARYGQPDFAWSIALSIHKQEMADLVDKLAKAQGALHQIAGKKDYADDPWDIARAALAVLTGDKP